MNDPFTCIAIVPALDRHPALLPLARRTLLEHAITTAAMARSVERVVVAGEAGDVTAAAVAAGAEVAGDVPDALARADDPVAVAVLLDVRFPLIRAADVDAVVAAVAEGRADFAFAARPALGGLWRSDGGPFAPAGPADPDAGTMADIGALRALLPQRALAGEGLGAALAVTVAPECALEVTTPEAAAAAALVLARRQPLVDRLPAQPAALILDFDGVFTDNRVLVDQDGREAVLCNRSDGLGLEQLRARGLPLLVLSKERNPVVAARCAKLQLECLQAVDDKGPALVDWCERHGVDHAHVIYVGNDTNDLPCFELVGCAVAVADSHPEALAAADVVLDSGGSFGALRELTDAIATRLEAAG